MTELNIFCFTILVQVYSANSYNLHHFHVATKCKKDSDQYHKWIRMGKNPTLSSFRITALAINQYIDDLTFLVHL